MTKIIQLPDDIISKIAAGEVIERPVYAVKELVENAIDAEASSVIVHVEQSGLARIAVIDDGEGISADELELAVKPHTTSKLRDEEMLAEIRTLGFRGEALSSISAISALTISSRTKDQAVGSMIVVRNGEIEKIVPNGMPVGTQVTIENLFGSVPARKKFLKSERTEFRRIIELVTEYALVHPEIRFVLTHNGKQVFDLPAGSDVSSRLSELLGKQLITSLLPVEYKDSYISLTGFLAKPQEVTKTGQKQYLYVNTRRVSDRLVSQAVKDAFGSMLETSSYPIFILYLSVPHELVDVNVHPRKEQIRFINTQLIYDGFYKAVSEVLANNNITFHTSLWDDVSTKKGSVDTYAGQLLKESVTPWDVRTEKILTTDITQLHNVYLLTATTHGFVLIDQHAAHERILYEQHLQAFEEKKKVMEIFQLTKPVVLELSMAERELLEEQKESLQEFGFIIESFGSGTYVVVCVPLLFRDRDIQKLVMELLEDLAEEKGARTLDRISKRMIAYLACRSAIMAGEKLNKKQMKELVEKLEQTPNNATCPHGRPTKIAVGLERVDKLFKRK